MKILLAAINAKYIHSNLAVYSLKGCTRHIHGVETVVREYTINNYTDEILAGLYREKPDVLAFSCYIWNLDMVEELADLMHKADPRLEIFWSEILMCAWSCAERARILSGSWLRGWGAA